MVFEYETKGIKVSKTANSFACKHEIVNLQVYLLMIEILQ